MPTTGVFEARKQRRGLSLEQTDELIEKLS